jgi:HD-GYP domain-containing protein (c-di-GMP phosphodiesterase class II)
MKTKKQTEKQELKYAPGDKVVYHCAGVDREGLIAYVDDSDNVAPYRINGMNIRESDIVEKVAKRRGRSAAKKQVEEKTEVVVNAESKQKPEEAPVVESFQEKEPLQESSCNEAHEQEQEPEQTLVEKYQAFKSTINMAEFNDLVDLVTADTKKMRQMMAESMQAIANDCGLKA